jgi:hypothetical protein
MVTLEADRSLFIISLKPARPRDRLERTECDSSLSLVDLDVSFGTANPPGCDLDSRLLGDSSFCFREKDEAQAGNNPFERESFGVDGVSVDIMRRDMGVQRCIQSPLWQKLRLIRESDVA